MNIVVCVKRVPDTAEAEVAIDRSGQGIDTEDLVYDINEWDAYAMEEAVLLKEQIGGTVTAVTMGSEDDEEVLRRCLALGADNAIRLTDPAFDGADGHATAVALAAAIERIPHDLIFTGVQASDDGYGQVGPALARMLGMPHATLVTNLEIDGRMARVRRELEGGLEETVEVQLPAVLTIQTGINEPRYVSIAGIRRVARREIPVQGVAELGLKPDQVGAAGSRIEVEGLSLPEVGQKGEILEGSLDAVTSQLVGIFASKGWLK
ncbi:MAG: electron transfer flavoprotein beta subunit/FixA family protein [Chloroflexota bacterium]|nr:MAG: electron transfer flavoprotein beta subunit/FixA family protein [Chloroflexota bacterium]